MNSSDAIKIGNDAADMISTGYLGNLTDQEFMHRPCTGCNHINWQVGHPIAAEHDLIEKVAPGTMPPLPEGFAAKYTKETSTSDDAKAFVPKDELLAAYKQQRAGTLAALAKQSDADLEKASGVDWCPTVASMFSMQGTHWLMHAGQWAVVRRQLGRKPMF